MASNPDLSSVLRTLSAFANPASNAAPGPTPGPTAAPTTAPVTANHKNNNDNNNNTTNHKHQQQQQQQQPKQRDLSTITTWPSALKHIMHLVSTSRNFSAQIQRLIKSQHDHERQWWAGREALVAKQKTREEKKKRLEEVLKSVGAPISGDGGGNRDSKEPAQENAAELNAYDSKVHQASMDMSRAMETELRRLGVPFFCLGVSTSSTSASTSTSMSMSTSTSTSAASPSSLSKDELDALKKRVLDLLVDLCT